MGFKSIELLNNSVFSRLTRSGVENLATCEFKICSSLLPRRRRSRSVVSLAEDSISCNEGKCILVYIIIPK